MLEGRGWIEDEGLLENNQLDCQYFRLCAFCMCSVVTSLRGCTCWKEGVGWRLRMRGHLRTTSLTVSILGFLHLLSCNLFKRLYMLEILGCVLFACVLL